MSGFEVYFLVMISFFPACLLVGHALEKADNYKKKAIHKKDRKWLKAAFKEEDNG
jgi:hypothetical protein